MIHTSLSPNTEADDLWRYFSALFFPWNWFWWDKGLKTKQFEEAFKEYLNVKHSLSFQRGRDALFVLLQAMGIGKGDEVILQAYTCIVVPNAIQYTNAKPVYVDIEEEGFNIDPAKIEEAITEKTKAVIIQNTFGEPANIEAIQEICRKHGVKLIEDCAHSLSATYKGGKVGTYGDAAIWSFGRDKIISSTWGGMITTDDEKLFAELERVHKTIRFPSFGQTVQALMHPIIFALAKPFYGIKLGKGLVVFSQILGLIPRVIFYLEKIGKKPEYFPQKMPNVLAGIALNQLNKIDRFLEHRRKAAEIYTEKLKGIEGIVLPEESKDSAWLRYTIRTKKAAEMLARGNEAGIYLGDWYRTVLAPEGCKPENFQYEPGSCPRAEKAAMETLNLPTHIQMTDEKIQAVVDFIKNEATPPPSPSAPSSSPQPPPSSPKA